jgi:hypothetical protein
MGPANPASIFMRRPAPGRQRVQHHGHRGGCGAGQVPPQPPGPADRGLQPHRPVIKPVRAGIGTGAGPLDHLLRQSGQIRQARAAPGGGQQDPVRIRPAVLRQLIGPLTQGLRPRAAQLASCERGGDQRMSGQPPGPRHRRTRSPAGDIGEGPQPRGGPVLPIRLMPPLGTERGQHPGPGHRVLGPGLLQPDQRLRLSRRPQAGSITPRQVPQPGPHHRQRLHRTRRRSRLTQGAHGRDHLPRSADSVVRPEPRFDH